MIGSAYLQEDLILGKVRTLYSLLIANVHNRLWCLMCSCTSSSATLTSTTDFLAITIVSFHKLIAAIFRRDNTVLTWDWLYNILWTADRASSFLWRSLFSLRSRIQLANGSLSWGTWGPWPLPHGYTGEGTLVRKEGLQSYFSRLIHGLLLIVPDRLWLSVGPCCLYLWRKLG